MSHLALSPETRLLALLLSESLMDPAERDIRPEDAGRIRDALANGQDWSILSMLRFLEEEPATEEAVRYVGDVLNLYRVLNDAHAALPDAERNALAKRRPGIADDLSWPGFDANNESEHLGIATQYIEKLGRFAELGGVALNSHYPTEAKNRRMLAVFEAQGGLGHHARTAAEIEAVLDA